MALEDASDRLGGDWSVCRVKGRVETCLSGNFGGELRGLEDLDVMQGSDGSVVRVIAGGPWQDLERGR